MNPKVDQYLLDGCMRCKYGGTPKCKVNNWINELEELRKIVIKSGLAEELKWGMPCYTSNNKNILMISAFKDYACISFFKGVLLKDKEKLLERAERFGIPDSELESRKKKERIERFGKTENQDKIKERIERFGLNSEKDKKSERIKRVAK